MEVPMQMVRSITTGADRVMAALIAGLELEFGQGAARGLAARFLDAEESEFHWEARTAERWIGRYEAADDVEIELDRIAITGRLDGRWFTAICIVDGEGWPHGIVARRLFRSRRQANAGFATMR
jgi:hypothetical protein